MDVIGKSLGIDPIEKTSIEGDIIQPRRSIPDISEASEEERDYAYARENFYNVIEKGTSALEDMLDVAKSSEHPRAYEVVSTLMKTLVDANKDLVKMGEEKRKLTNTNSDTPVTNNNLFVGSTSDLQQMLKDLRDNDE